MQLPPMYRSTLGQTRLGASDPTCSMDADRYRRALLTPAGPGVLDLRITSIESGLARVDAFGPGRDWVLAHHRDMLGLSDQPPLIRAAHPEVERAQRRFGALRIARTRSPYQDLLMAVLGQRITARDAARQWRRLVTRLGSVAPGPGNLMLPPAPETLTSLPYFALHELGIERRRADTLRHVASRAAWLFSLAEESHAPQSQLTTALERIPGVGPWTAAVAGGTAFGDPDALRVGDFHVKNTVAWALAGRPRGSDAEMIGLLSPYAGQRDRVVRWLQASCGEAPRFGPGRRNVDIALI